MVEDEALSTILYYGREKFYHAMQETALEGISKFSNSNVFSLYNGIALVIGNRIQEGIRELMPLIRDKETVTAAILALIYAHKKCAIVDKEALVNLETKLKEEKRNSSYLTIYHAALFLYYSGYTDKAQDYVDRSLKLNSEFNKALSLKGWITLYSENLNADAVRHYFDKSLEYSNNLDPHLGLVKLHMMRKEYEAAITILNKVIVKYPHSIIPLIEKMYVQLAKWDWDQSLETSVRILQISEDNLQAHIVKLLVLLCRDGNYENASKSLRKLSMCLEKHESKNNVLFTQCAQLFSRISGRNKMILNETYRLAEYAVQLNSANSEAMTELGYQSMLQGNNKEALRFFQSATKTDNGSVAALCGLTLCQLYENGSTEQVNQQIEFLMEVQGATNLMPLLNFMSAKLVRNDSQSAISLLNNAYDTHFKALYNLPYGIDYLNKLNPDFLLQLTKEYLIHSPTKSIIKSEILSNGNVHVSIKQAMKILSAITKACPGHIEAAFQLAKVYYFSGEISEANIALQKILDELDVTFPDAHLLVAQIYVQQNSYHRAAQSLEICLSYNFSIRENPMYHLIMGIVQKEDGHIEDSIKSFGIAMNLIHSKKDNENLLNLADKVTLYLEFVDAYMESDQYSEAAKLLEEATAEFHDTSESGRIIIANADLSVKSGDIQQALILLGNILPLHPYYLQAKTKLAYIYLHKCKDRQAFAQCFRELVENCPGHGSYVMLGDAYMSIQEPDHAIEAYAQAMAQSPNDSNLASKMGRALVKTHQYAKAISYYKEAIANSQNSHLKLDMSELYMKLNQFESAEKVLMEELDASKNVIDDLSVLQLRTKQLLLLSRIKEKSGNLRGSLASLQEAKENQFRVQKRISVEQNSSSILEQQRLSSQVCVLMAEHCSHLRESVKAVEHYKEALKFLPNDADILTSLARTYMQMNNLAECENTCAILLESEPNHEGASVMMADLTFRKVDFDGACFHFAQLLLAQPLYWTALARLVEVMRRSARLDEVPPFIERAQRLCDRPHNEAGLSYCKAMYEWYAGNPNAALRHFNDARRDSEWGQQAIYNMIEICLHPDDDSTSEATDLYDDAEFRDNRSMALRTAERLLTELKPRLGGMDNEALNHKLLGNFLLLATRQKINVERALQDFTALASQPEYRDQVGPNLGMAMAYIMQKNSQRARNQLKRVAKNTWTFEEAEYLERCWLLLADLYIQSSKYDLAGELLKRVLQHNRSCIKAYELAGFIAEKEQNNKNAFMNYENAWKFGRRSNPHIGFRLAYNFMKNKRYADALETCSQILKLHPNFPRVKKDIMEKCKNNLRT